MLKDQLKKLFGETAIYGISSILTKLISIFLIPLYTSVLDPSDYGTLNLLTSFLSLSLIISIFALDNSAARWFYDTDEVSDKKKTISSWVYFQSFSTLLIGLLLIVGAPLIKDDILSLPSNDIYYIAVASFLLGVLPSITPNWFRMQRRAISTISYTISFSLITIGFTIYFVLFMNLGVKGIFMATLISNGIMSIVSLFIMKGWYNFKDVNLNRIKELLLSLIHI